jgi:molybdopterin molybdotransferase
MIEVEDVWDLIDGYCAALPPERVRLVDALGCTLAADAVADADAPPFDRSTVDGYAIRRADAAEEFLLVGTIAAGDADGRMPGAGEAVRIFTGAALPGPGLQVIMQEDATSDAGRVRFTRRGAEGNFRPRGEDVRAGETLLRRGGKLGPVELAMLASIGEAMPLVVRRPRILHFTSGNEIVAVEEVPGPGMIRNSNATLIRALASGFPTADFAHVHLPDDAARAWELIEATEPGTFDVVLFSGGASVGDHDHTRGHLEQLGFEIRCSQVNVRPGKPLILATGAGRTAFGLPGNPVSHFVCFHLFVARALARLAGREPRSLAEATLAAEIPGRPTSRVTFWPAQGLAPVPWNSSGHLASLVGVDALVRVPAQAGLPKAGESVQILRLSDS